MFHRLYIGLVDLLLCGACCLSIGVYYLTNIFGAMSDVGISGWLLHALPTIGLSFLRCETEPPIIFVPLVPAA